MYERLSWIDVGWQGGSMVVHGGRGRAGGKW